MSVAHSSPLTHPGKKKRLQFLLAISLVLILTAGGLLFTLYSSYSPLRTIFTLRMSNSISSIAWSPDSRVFAAVTYGEGVGTSMAMVSVWRTSDGRELYTYVYPSAPISHSQLAWSPDGRSFAIAWDDGNVTIWGVANDYTSWPQKSSFHIPVHTSANSFLTGIAWSAIGKHLLVSYSDGRLFVWDVQDRQMLPPILAPQVAGEKSSIRALSPHGTQAIISGQLAGSDVPFAIWDIATGKEMPVEGGIVAWTPDENAVAVGDGSEKVTIWQWKRQSTTWAFVHAITAGTSLRQVDNLAWSSDGKYLATVDIANVIRLWNAEDGDLLGPHFPLFDHPLSKNEEYVATDTAITALAWSPNGKYLLSGDNVDQVILQQVL